MLKNSENSLASTRHRGTLAVLFLPPPPDSGGLEDWYWRKIAGVPFILRNILNIQRGGIQHVVLFVNHQPQAVGELHRRIASDPRVTLSLEWLSDSEEWVQKTGGFGEFLLLDGSALYDKTQIKSAVAGNPDSEEDGKYRAFWVDRNSLVHLLEAPDAFDFSSLEKVKEQSPPSAIEDQDSEIKSLVYFPEAAIRKVLSEGDFHRESERIVQRSGGLSNDSLATRILSRPVSKLITRRLLNTQVTPNQITLLSFIIGLGSAGCFFQGGYAMGLIGAGLLLFSIWVDGVDGEIARIKFMETKLGGKLDIYCDNIVHIAVFFSIGMGLFHTHGDLIYIVLGGLAAIGSLISFLMLGTAVTEGKSKAHSADENDRKKSDFVDKLANRDFTHFLFVLALFGRVDVFLWLTAIGVNFLVLYLLFLRTKSTSKLKSRAE